MIEFTEMVYHSYTHWNNAGSTNYYLNFFANHLFLPSEDLVLIIKDEDYIL